MRGKIFLETARFSLPVVGAGVYAGFCAVANYPVSIFFYLACGVFLVVYHCFGDENLCRLASAVFVMQTFTLLEFSVFIFDVVRGVVPNSLEFLCPILLAAAIAIPISAIIGVYRFLRDGAERGESVDGHSKVNLNGEE